MLKRIHLLSKIETALKRSRVVVLLGPRQCGKTTMARELVDEASPSYFDLEDPVSLARLGESIRIRRRPAGKNSQARRRAPGGLMDARFRPALAWIGTAGAGARSPGRGGGASWSERPRTPAPCRGIGGPSARRRFSLRSH